MKTLSRWLAPLLCLLLCALACTPSKPAGSADSLVVGKGDGGADPGTPAVAAAQSEDDAAIPVFATDATRGSRLAAVTLVVFSDFQCPFCSRMVPTLDRLYAGYGADNLRIVFKNQPLPFHQHAQLAAEVGQGVLELSGNEAFWRFHDTAFEKQRDIGPDQIIAWATAAGVDERQLRDGIATKRWAAKVNRDKEVGRAHGANGTPASFIDGIALVGARPYEDFKALIDTELKESKALAEQGIPKDQIYTRLTAQNYKDVADGEARDDRAEADREAAEMKEIHKVPVGTSPMRGPATAEVTIIEFSDFQCPYCKKAEPTMERIRKEYGDKVRIVWKDLPLSFHLRAEPAAELARNARLQKGDASFWQVHDALLASKDLEDADLEQIAKDAKLDPLRAMAAVKAKTHAAAIDADVAVADDFSAAGTPNFFVNGHHMVGAQKFEKFKAVIDEEILRAEALLKSGTTRAALYDALIKDGKGATEPERRTITGLAPNAPTRGPAGAKVVIQEFADFQCPFCGRVQPALDELMNAFPGKVKIVWRDKPLAFHPDAMLAAEAGREAFKQKGSDGFNKFSALLWKNQTQIKRDNLDDYARQVGLDMPKFAAALDNHTHVAAINAEAQLADDAKMSGTPGFLIGPYFLAGAQPLAKFKKLVTLAMNPPPAPPKPKSEPTPVAAPAPARQPSPGLVVNDLKVGAGREVKSGDTVKVEYVGKLTDGSEFDTSRGRAPFTTKIGVGQVIRGWDEGILGMKVGGKRKLTIPPDLGYGDRGAGAKIPPKATLVFEVELLEIQ